MELDTEPLVDARIVRVRRALWAGRSRHDPYRTQEPDYEQEERQMDSEEIDLPARPPRSATHHQSIGGTIPFWREPRRTRILIDEAELPLVSRALVAYAEAGCAGKEGDIPIAESLARYISAAVTTTGIGRCLDTLRQAQWRAAQAAHEHELEDEARSEGS